MRGLLVPLVLLVTACQAVPTPSGFRAPTLQPGETVVTGQDAVFWPWHEPANYSFMMDSRVALVTLGGQEANVVVRGHRRMQPTGGTPSADARYPTFAELQQRAARALAGGAFVAAVLAADGRPTFVYIDNERWMDDEFSAWMTEYQPQ